MSRLEQLRLQILKRLGLLHIETLAELRTVAGFKAKGDRIILTYTNGWEPLTLSDLARLTLGFALIEDNNYPPPRRGREYLRDFINEILNIERGMETIELPQVFKKYKLVWEARVTDNDLWSIGRNEV